MERGLAPAKVNLALKVTGRRADGYHLLDSLVCFTDLGDRLTAFPAETLSLAVEGPFSEGVPTDDSNLVLRAAGALARARGVTAGARITLSKMLPHAAGIGSASSDAAATLRLLAEFWSVAPLPPGSEAVQALGADVPVCLAAPRPRRMRGIGETLQDPPLLPNAGLVLVNPGAELPTAKVFAALERTEGHALRLPSGGWPDAAALAEWIEAEGNDLLDPARKLAPEIDAALARLKRLPQVLGVTMSGSGATCVGITRDLGHARQVARAIQLAEQSWWVAPAAILR